MTLGNADKKRYRAIGHNLKPVVIIAQKGISENIKAEIERALKDHELIKIKLITENKEEKQALSESICKGFAAELVQSVGSVILIYKEAKKQNPRLSNLKRYGL